jgi:hypothetical protein
VRLYEAREARVAVAKACPVCVRGGNNPGSIILPHVQSEIPQPGLTTPAASPSPV